MSDAQFFKDLKETYRTFNDYRYTADDIARRQCSIIRRYRFEIGKPIGKKEAPRILKSLFPKGVLASPIKMAEYRDSLDKEQCHLFDLCRHFKEAELDFRTLAKPYKKLMVEAVRSLDLWTEWAKDVRGIAEFMLAEILGECGAPSNFPRPQHLWKFMGIGLIRYPNGDEDPEIQRKCRDKKKAEAMGYNPRKRSLVWNLGACLIRSTSPYYYGVYCEEKQRQLNGGNGMTPSHAHNRAKRYMEKRFLRDLWLEWNRLHGVSEEPKVA